MLMLRQNHKKTGIISSLVICSVLILTALFLILNRQNITDQITVWQYHSTVEISSLVDRAGMNDNGKFYYLASQPKLDATSDFNKECDRIENDTSILGCYSGLRIYIYDVTDQQLDGVREVTATHETLHAIYARMSDGEKDQVDSLIETEYNKLKNDQDFADLMAFYARTEPGQRDNELHSIIGTEVAAISPELEAHYSKYFTNRQKVVSLNAKYSGTFKQLKSRADELLKQYNSLSADILVRLDRYNADVAVWNNDVASFKQKFENREFTSQVQIDSQLASLNIRSENLTAVRKILESDINKRNAILDAYNSIATESKKLYNIINSTLAPAPSV